LTYQRHLGVFTLSTLARWCYRHRLIVVLLWLVAIAALGVASRAAGSAYSDSFSLPGTESTKALQLLQKSLPAQSGDSGTVVWQTSQGTVRDGSVRQRMTPVLDKIAKLPSVSGVTSPYDPRGARQISKDGRTAYAQISFDQLSNKLPKGDVQRVIDTAEQGRGAGLRVELGGNPISQVERTPPSSSEAVGVLAAAIVLFIAFGSLFAMLLPIVTAIAGVGTGLLTVGLLTHALSIGQIGPILGALIGLGVGIDYALFIVTRHRTGLRAGMTVEESVVKAIDTSGRAVLFAGATVVIALCGMFVLGLSFLNGLAIASATTVVATVLAAITLLPAMLGFLGMRTLSRRERRLTDAGTPSGGGVWQRWASVVQRRPGVLSAVAIVLIGVLSLPVFSLRLGSSDAGNNPSSTTTRQAYDMLAGGFGPGFNGPLQLVGETPTPADQRAFGRLADDVGHLKGVAGTAALPMPPGSKIGIVQVIPTTSPQSKQTSDLIDRIRHDVVPPAERGTTMTVYVGGATAIFNDFAGVLTGKVPLFLGAGLHLVAGGVPEPARAGDGGGDEHSRRGGLVRRDRGVLPVGLGIGAARPGRRRAGRGVPAGDHAFGAVRPVDGLPGVPGQPDARGVGAHQGQRAGGQRRPGADRPGDHCRGHDHDRRVRGVRLRRSAGHRRVRHRPGRRRRPGRVHPAYDPGSGGHAPVRVRQLVAAEVAGPASPAPVGRAGRRAGEAGSRARTPAEPQLSPAGDVGFLPGGPVPRSRGEKTVLPGWAISGPAFAATIEPWPFDTRGEVADPGRGRLGGAGPLDRRDDPAWPATSPSPSSRGDRDDGGPPRPQRGAGGTG
jgi:RND superfamily putative drug exporter